MGRNMKTRTDYLEWHELLDVPMGGLGVIGIESRLWGKEYVVHFLYNPLTQDKPFHILFKDCSSYRWDTVGSEIDERDVNADVIGFGIGLDQHRQPAVLTTDLFEISIHYGSLVVEKDW
jgi:hypothetical protein